MHPITFTVFLLFTAALITLNLTLLTTILSRFKSEDFQLTIAAFFNICICTPMVYVFGQKIMSNGAMTLVGIVLGAIITALSFFFKEKL